MKLEHFKFGLAFTWFLLLSALNVQGQEIVSFRVQGQNGPDGNSFNELVTFDGNSELVSNGQISVTERLFSIEPGVVHAEIQFESTVGQLVNRTDTTRWDIAYQLVWDRDVIVEDQDNYFFFTRNGIPIDLLDSEPSVASHPFDPSIEEVSTYTATRDANERIFLGIFSDPFTIITNRLGVPPEEVTGFTIGNRFVVAVPEPASSALLALTGCCLWIKRRRCTSLPSK